MEKYSISSLVPEITGIDEDSFTWEAESKKVYRIDKMIRSLVSNPPIGDITDRNKDWYVSICKTIYENPEMYRVTNKNSKIGEIKRPKGKRMLTEDENITFLEMLKESCLDDNIRKSIERSIYETKGESYKKAIKYLHEEIDRITESTKAYPYEDRVRVVNEIAEYLEEQRRAIDKIIEENLIKPEEYYDKK